MTECLEACRRAADTDESLPEAIRIHRFAEVALWLESFGIRLRPDSPTLISRIRRTIEAAPETAWSTAAILAALARQGEAMSAPTLRRRLAAQGTSLQALMTDVRLTIALAQLQATERPITTIAADVGYLSASRFALRFRARFGVPPSAIRERTQRIERAGTEVERYGTARPAAE